MSNLKYSEDHEWLRIEADGSITVGITDFAQNQLGDLVFIQLPQIDQKFEKNEEAVVIESVKAAGEIKMPVAGTIVEVNDTLEAEPALVSQDPFKKGWFFRIKAENLNDLNIMMDELAYASYIANLS